MDNAVITVTPKLKIAIPALFAPTRKAAKCFIEFFVAKIGNDNTRKAYGRAVVDFAAWCEANELLDLQDIEPIHVATYVETLQLRLSDPSVKLHLAAIRRLFDCLVVGQVVALNPASPVRGPAHSAKKGKTRVLSAQEARALLECIDPSTVVGLRDRALIGLMVYTFARIGAALQMTVEDVYVEKRRAWIKLLEKGGKDHRMPCHHNLEAYLHAYIEGAGIGSNPMAFLFPTADWKTGKLSKKPMTQADAYRMVQRRAAKAGILTKIGNHSFRATGITEYLRNGGKLEVAQQMANHESARTTGLYDRRSDDVSLDEIEKIII